MSTPSRRLGVNIDHVATLRQARMSPYPEPVLAALLAEHAGAGQITCHIRCDRRHVNERDIRLLRETIKTQLNVECAATDEMVSIMEALRPHRVTLVPERPEEVTTEGGLDLTRPATLAEVKAAAARLVAAGIRVSLFIDPADEQVRIAGQLDGVDMIELNTAHYAEGHPEDLARLTRACVVGQGLDLEIAAGHGLTHHNLPDLVKAVPEIVEYNIGHSIISRAVFVGLDRAVRDILAIILQS
ncbi:MAG: pyridoxine 5'-phosphate synthase [Alphaproteobacteria bacterium]|nr:pyridoxine 5'-phosphate synthase [Alphaproteobacteria bacterium]